MLKSFGFILYALTCINAFAKPIPKDERDYKAKNLANFTLVSDSPESSQMRKHLISIAADYQDVEILDKFFSECKKPASTGPAEACPKYLFDVYSKNPGFFLRAADSYFRGNLNQVSSQFINEKHPYTLGEVEAPLAKIARHSADYTYVVNFRALLKAAAKRYPQK